MPNKPGLIKVAGHEITIRAYNVLMAINAPEKHTLGSSSVPLDLFGEPIDRGQKINQMVWLRHQVHELASTIKSSKKLREVVEEIFRRTGVIKNLCIHTHHVVDA